MIRLFDGKKLVEIEMIEEQDEKVFPDFSADFFEVGGLKEVPEFYDHRATCYKVNDVDYCIDQARDWEALSGDYALDDDSDVCVYRTVSIEGLYWVYSVGGDNDGMLLGFFDNFKCAMKLARMIPIDDVNGSATIINPAGEIETDWLL